MIKSGSSYSAFYALSPPSPKNPSIMSVTANIFQDYSHVGRELRQNRINGFSQSELWLTSNSFSLEDFWASIPEAQSRQVGCHAEANSLSLGFGAFLLGRPMLDKPESQYLFMFYRPLITVSTCRGTSQRSITFLDYHKKIFALNKRENIVTFNKCIILKHCGSTTLPLIISSSGLSGQGHTEGQKSDLFVWRATLNN